MATSMLLTRFHSSLGPGAVAGTCKHAGPCTPRAMLQGRNVTPLPDKTRLCQAKGPTQGQTSRERGRTPEQVCQPPTWCPCSGPRSCPGRNITNRRPRGKNICRKLGSPGPWLPGEVSQQTMKLGKAGGEGSRKSQNLRTGEPQAQEQSSRPGPVIQQM